MMTDPNITIDAAFPIKPTLRLLDAGFQPNTGMRFGIWDRLALAADTARLLPPDLVDVDPNRFYVELLDQQGSIKDTTLEGSVCYSRGQQLIGTVTANFTRVSATRFLSEALLLITDTEELHSPAGGWHSLSHRMLEAHAGGDIYAFYAGTSSARVPVTPTTRSYRAHIFVVTQNGAASSGPFDPWLMNKRQAAVIQHARGLRIYERLGMRLQAEPYTGPLGADLVVTDPLVDARPLHVVQAPSVVNTNAMSETTMELVAERFPPQDGIARIFVVGSFAHRGLAFPLGSNPVALAPALTDCLFVNCAISNSLTMTHELGHLLGTDHIGNEFCLMDDSTNDLGDWRSSKWVYMPEFNQWPNRRLTSS